MDIEWTAAKDYSHYVANDGEWVLIAMPAGGYFRWTLHGPNFFQEIKTDGGLYAALDIATEVVKELTK